jgi:N-acyl-phosphatidylethanolamine-hydrolysing phospholipase D
MSDCFVTSPLQRIVPLGVKKLLSSAGITNVVELDWWGSYHHLTPQGVNIEIVFTPTKHWTSRTPFDRNTCLWGSYSVLGAESRFFFTGDTAYCSVFKTVSEFFGPYDMAAIPIGAYTPRWFMKDVHCNPEEAVKIHQDLRAKRSCAIHWGTFPMTGEDPVEPAFELARIRSINRMDSSEFFTMGIGETMTIHDQPQHDLATKHDDIYGQFLQTPRASH